MNSDGHDYTTAYRELRERVTALARARAADLELIAPATPEWRVRDVIAHLGGICDDIANGNVTGIGTDPWTAAHVDKRRDWDVERVLDDWAMHAGAVEPGLNDIPPAIIGQLVLDAATHEHDVRGALDAPGARDAEVVVIGYEWAVGVLEQQLAAAGATALRFDTEDGVRTLGDAGAAITTVRASRFELVRAITGRRSRAQVAGLDWDPEPRPDDLIFGDLVSAPEADLVE